jgi:hypothetical protein
MTPEQRPVIFSFPGSIGMLMLGLWLILWGIFSLVHVEAGTLILAIWAIITGFLLLIGR